MSAIYLYIASENKTKIKAAQIAICWALEVPMNEVKVSSYTVESGIPEQPFGWPETEYGSKNRLENLRGKAKDLSKTGLHILLAPESGIIEEKFSIDKVDKDPYLGFEVVCNSFLVHLNEPGKNIFNSKPITQWSSPVLVPNILDIREAIIQSKETRNLPSKEQKVVGDYLLQHGRDLQGNKYLNKHIAQAAYYKGSEREIQLAIGMFAGFRQLEIICEKAHLDFRRKFISPLRQKGLLSHLPLPSGLAYSPLEVPLYLHLASIAKIKTDATVEAVKYAFQPGTGIGMFQVDPVNVSSENPVQPFGWAKIHAAAEERHSHLRSSVSREKHGLHVYSAIQSGIVEKTFKIDGNNHYLGCEIACIFTSAIYTECGGREHKFPIIEQWPTLMLIPDNTDIAKAIEKSKESGKTNRPQTVANYLCEHLKEEDDRRGKAKGSYDDADAQQHYYEAGDRRTQLTAANFEAFVELRRELGQRNFGPIR